MYRLEHSCPCSKLTNNMILVRFHDAVHGMDILQCHMKCTQMKKVREDHAVLH